VVALGGLEKTPLVGYAPDKGIIAFIIATYQKAHKVHIALFGFPYLIGIAIGLTYKCGGGITPFNKLEGLGWVDDFS
jgi:hypothetical protein